MSEKPEEQQGNLITPARRPMHPLSGYPAPEGVPETLGPTRIGTMDYTKLIGTGKGYMQSYDYVINPFAGCSFGCSYCYASNFRTSDAQKDSWGKWVQIKANADAQMSETHRGALNGRTVYMSTATDPYQPIERWARVTRQILERMVKDHPKVLLVVQTRSTLVKRDADLLLEIVEGGGQVQVNMTISTDDDSVRRTYEPGCSSIAARMSAVAALNRQGLQTCVTCTPMLPMSDPEGFINALIDGGTKRFILQPFRYQSNDNRSFIARTDRRAIDSAKAHYGTTEEDEAIRQYNADYLRGYRAICRELEHRPEITLGFDREGFKPPFARGPSLLKNPKPANRQGQLSLN